MYFDNYNLDSIMNQNITQPFSSTKQHKFGQLDLNQNCLKDKNQYLYQTSNFFSNDKKEKQQQDFFNKNKSIHNLSSPHPNYFSFNQLNNFTNNLNHFNNNDHLIKKPKLNLLQSNKEFDYLFNQTNLNNHHQQTKDNTTARIWHERPQNDQQLNDEQPSIFTLQPELWAIIFRNLCIKDKGNVARTCRFFRDVVYNKSVWKGDVARFFLRKNYNVVLESLKRRGIKNIQILGLEHSLKELQSISNLKDLDCSGCVDLTDKKIIKGLTSKLSNLERLSLSMCKHITDNSILHISIHLTSLLKLDVSGCINITDQSLIALIKGLKKLKSLNLKSCMNITHKGIAYICGYKVPENNNQNDMDQLELDQADFAIDNEKPKVDLNSALVDLEELILQDCQKLNDDVLKYLPLGLSQLKNLNLNLCNSITEFGLKNLANHPNLIAISLRNCNNISDIGLKYLSEANIVKLMNLDISFCEKVNDKALDYIAQGLKELRSLSLNNCSITDNGLIKIGQNLTKLNHLNVGQCTKITEKSLSIVVENCVNLESIDLYGCTEIKNFDKLKKLPKLNKLNINMKTKEDEINDNDIKDDKLNSRKRKILNSVQENLVDENNNLPDVNSLSTSGILKDTQNQMLIERDLAKNFVNAAAQATLNAFNYQQTFNNYFLPHFNSFLPSHLNYLYLLTPPTPPAQSLAVNNFTQLNNQLNNQLNQFNPSNNNFNHHIF